MRYVVIDKLNDYEEIKEFNNLKDAQNFIKDLKRFDKEQKNPFKTDYVIFIESEE